MNTIQTYLIEFVTDHATLVISVNANNEEDAKNNAMQQLGHLHVSAVILNSKVRPSGILVPFSGDDKVAPYKHEVVESPAFSRDWRSITGMYDPSQYRLHEDWTRDEKKPETRVTVDVISKEDGEIITTVPLVYVQSKTRGEIRSM